MIFPSIFTNTLAQIQIITIAKTGINFYLIKLRFFTIGRATHMQLVKDNKIVNDKFW